METMVAYCGLDCESCPIHQATLEADPARQQAMRQSIAELCSVQYGMNLQAEEVTDCDGCRANTGRLFSGCAQCAIRACIRSKNLESCAYCPHYACEKLLKHFELDPLAKDRLDQIRTQI